MIIDVITHSINFNGVLAKMLEISNIALSYIAVAQEVYRAPYHTIYGLGLLVHLKPWSLIHQGAMGHAVLFLGSVNHNCLSYCTATSCLASWFSCIQKEQQLYLWVYIVANSLNHTRLPSKAWFSHLLTLQRSSVYTSTPYRVGIVHAAMYLFCSY